MCLQKLMNIHHYVFKILGKNQSVTDGHKDERTDGQMDGRTDGQHENSIPHYKQSLRGV